MKLTIKGPPRTKKNHGRRRYSRRKRMIVNIPSEAFEDFEARALPQLKIDWMRLARGKPITVPCNVAALFYRDALRGDAVGYYQALADVLQKAGVVKDDVLVEQWDGSRMMKDAERPRIELTITLLPTDET